MQKIRGTNKISMSITCEGFQSCLMQRNYNFKEQLDYTNKVLVNDIFIPNLLFT